MVWGVGQLMLRNSRDEIPVESIRRSIDQESSEQEEGRQREMNKSRHYCFIRLLVYFTYCMRPLYVTDLFLSLPRYQHQH